MRDHIKPRGQAYALLRIAMGTSLFLHGATRIAAGVDKFAGTLIHEFQTTFLPVWAVHAFGVALPFAEGTIGLLLLVGWLTQYALLAGMAVLILLIFGTALRAEWNTIGLQLIYSLILYVLLVRIGDNCWALDRTLVRRPREPLSPP